MNEPQDIQGFTLSPQQERLWRQQAKSGKVFRAQAKIGLEGSVDVALLEAALADLIEHNEILRTVFPQVMGLELPVQAVAEASPISLEPGDAPETAEGSPPVDLDLEKGSALRCVLREGTEGAELLVEMPALYADGASLDIFTERLAEAYLARSRGESILEVSDEEDEEALQYADIAAWQCDLLETEEGERPSWSPSPAPALAEMRLGSERSEHQAGGLERVEELWDGKVAALEAVAGQHGVPTRTLLLACWGLLLARRAGCAEVVVGVLFEDRDYEGLDQMLGLLTKAMPITIHPIGNEPFPRLLSDLEARLAEAAEELESFFWDASEPVGGAGSFPFLFSSRALPAPVDAGALSFKLQDQSVEMEHCAAGLDLLLTDNGLRVRLNYDSAVLGAESAHHLLAGWLRLLHQVVEGSEASLRELDDLASVERKAVLAASCGPAAPTIEVPFARLFERRAAESPEAIAAHWDGDTLAYGELDRRANQLAHYLLDQGLIGEERVGLQLDRSFEMLVAILGILKAGGAYLPLDPDSPIKRRLGILEEAGSRFLLTRAGAGFKDLAALAGQNHRLVHLDTEGLEIAKRADTAPPEQPDLEQLAYMIYTSGSTGRPKGVMVSHRGLASYLLWAIETYGLGKNRRSIVHSPLSFDLTVTSLLAPLTAGASVVLVSDERGIGPLSQVLAEATVDENNAFLVKMTPAHLDLLMTFSHPEELAGKIDTMVLGGEALRWDSVGRWQAIDPATHLINEYGPTETVVGCSIYEASGQGRAGVPIGRPVPGMQLYVLDSALALLPFGGEGEIYIGGASVARGYLGLPRQNAERFLPDPFAGEPGRRFYRTGDLGRLRADGELEYRGRVDTQIKLHGYRIELGEIEHALVNTPGVQEAVVVLRTDPATGSPLLVAYLLAAGDLAHGGVRDALEARLPTYMVPAVFQTVVAWPLTPNGKVDREALPEWRRSEGGSSTQYVAPRNVAEEVLCKVWAEVLRQEQVGVEDDFFHLGGDSILTITALTKIRAWGFELTPQDFFNHSKLADLARQAMVSNPGSITVQETAPAFSQISEADRERLPSGVEDAYPMAHLQAGMLFHSSFAPDSAVYHDMTLFKVRAKLDRRALRAVLERAISAHETLRTSFSLAEYSVPLQLVHAHLPLPLRVEDLRHFLPEEQEAELVAWRKRELETPFDPEKPPLIRFHVLIQSADTFQLVLSYHHSIVDGWSVAALLAEIFRHYVTVLHGDIYHPPEESHYAFRDFIAIEGKTVGSTDQREFWQQELRDCRPLHLPLIDEHREDRPPEIRFQEIPIDEELAQRLVERASLEKVPVKALLLAAHCEVLGYLTDQGEVLTGVVTHGRPEVPGGESLIGLFLNTLPMRMHLRRQPRATWSDLVREVFDWERRTIAYRRFPVAEIQRLLGVQELLQTVFNFVHFHVYRDLSPHPEVEVLDADFFEETNFTFAANFMYNAAAGTFVGRLDYDASVLDPLFIERAAGYYRTFLEALAETPEEVRSDHSPLSAEERRQLLVEWSGPPTEVPEETLLERFRGWAETNGDEPALLWSQGSLSYRELDQRVGRLAHILGQHGVVEGTVVGVSCHGSPEAVVAFLAIFEAEGIYLPLDPSYPEDHRLFMAREAQTALVLCTAETQSLLRVAGAERLVVDLDELGRGAVEVDHRGRGASLEDTAYLIFTSGSTGRPKGVILHHRGLANLGEQQRQLFDLGPGRRVLLFASLNFDASMWEMAMAFWSGAALSVGTRKELLPDLGLIETLRSQRITHVTLPPTALATLPADDLPDLVYLVSAGEALSPALVRRWATPGRHFYNAYGPTESTVCATLMEVTPDMPRPLIGGALPNIRIWVLDRRQQLAPQGVPGQLYLGGVGLARGYLRRPALTAERFVPDPWSGEPGARLYATGDQVSFHADGLLDYIGRIDRQVKVRGFRIEPGEIELRLAEHPGLRQVAVVTRGTQASSQLIAFAVPQDNGLRVEDVRRFLGERLPAHMVPGRIIYLDSMPLTANGKINYKILERLEATEAERPGLSTTFVTPRSEIERSVAEVVREVLEIDRVGLDDNIFDLGGHSLHLLRIQGKLRQLFDKEIPLMEFFEHTTVRELAILGTPAGEPSELRVRSHEPRTGNRDIAIIGMAGRFPGANNVDELWHNLAAGQESITFFSNEELFAAGVEPEIFEDPSYVPARGVLDNVEYFDAAFFGFTPREAAIMDPQHRLFLEHAWVALESAGYNPVGSQVPVGVFGGTSANSYMFQLMANPEIVESIGAFQAVLSNDKDFLSTQASYKLNLEGPSVTVQTACSTSMVAVHIACQSLLAGECEMALAGGVSVRLPQVSGHRYMEGGIDSPDGHCRAFDAKAAGTVAGNGVGIVVLKPLEKALADGDRVLAVVKGSAINNDGSHKVGYTAPRIEGQARVIREAHLAAGVDARSISYVEAHGTGTHLGDPIEVSALTRAFRASSDEQGFCALGSVKSNFGHLDAAAGVTGLIKAVLALNHKAIPASLHYESPNPRLELATSPFYVPDHLTPWNTTPRLAGVSSFGIGGTNVHLVLEEAPEIPHAPAPAREHGHLLPLSAHTEVSLEQMRQQLADHLEAHPELEIADVAHTLQVGRQSFAQRMLWQVTDRDAAVAELRRPESGRRSVEETRERAVAFLLPGQGAQYPNMARELYDHFTSFRNDIDYGAELLEKPMGFNLRDALFPAKIDQAAHDRLANTAVAQPAIFLIEHSLARLWISLGVRPQALLGHSIGELTAACLAGVFRFEDALELVCTRGRLVGELPPGSMLSVACSEKELGELPEGVEIAALNGPQTVVLSGTDQVISSLADELEAAEDGPQIRRLVTSHAFHSTMMEPAVAAFEEAVAAVPRRQPNIPFLSNVSGDWIQSAEAVDPAYWGRHLRSTVRFGEGLERLFAEPERVLLEVGPGQTMSTLARRHPKHRLEVPIIPSLPHVDQSQRADEHLIGALGELWLNGQPIDWQTIGNTEGRLLHRVFLPTYAFDRHRHWVDGDPRALGNLNKGRRQAVEGWLYTPTWQRDAPARVDAVVLEGLCLLLSDGGPAGEATAEALRALGAEVVTVEVGEAVFERRGQFEFAIVPGEKVGYDQLFAALDSLDRPLTTIVHGWNIEPTGADDRERGLFSLVQLGRQLATRPPVPRRLLVVASGLYDVLGGEPVLAFRRQMEGPCLVIPQEIPHLSCRLIDPGPEAFKNPARFAERLCEEFRHQSRELSVAWRGTGRWHQIFKQLTPRPTPELKAHGVYLLFGGLGKIGLTIAENLVREGGVRLLLTRRTALPEQELDAVLKLRELGGDVQTAAFDLADENALRTAVDEAAARWGQIDGVFHFAGAVGEGTFRALDELDRAEIERQFQAKVEGTLALSRVLEGRDIGFCILFSSLSSTLGGLGFGAYAAANAFQGAFVEEQRRRELPWTTIDWDGWHFPVSAEDAAHPHGIRPHEGIRALNRAMAYGDHPRLLVSISDLEERQKRWVNREHEEDRGAETGGTAEVLQSRPGLKSSYVAPETDTQRRLVALWTDLLGIDNIGIQDNFFELGGHSLLATQLASRLHEVLGRAVPLRAIFDNPTINQLAQSAGEAAAEEPPQLAIAPRDQPIPLSFAQKRLWFLDQMEGGGEAYNIFTGVRLAGLLVRPALVRSLNEIIRRHEILRTVVDLEQNEPVQVIQPFRSPVIPEIDLRTLPEEAREGAAYRAAQQFNGLHFVLNRGPLLSFSTLRLADHEHVFCLAVHHIVCDGWSVGVFIRELSALYAAFSAGEPSPLLELPTQYADYAVWQRDWLEEQLEPQVAYWQKRLRDLPTVALPLDHPRPDQAGSRGASAGIDLELELADRLRAFAQDNEVTLFMMLLAAFNTLLHLLTGQEDLVVGTNVAGRRRPELEPLVGCFINNLVLRTEFDAEQPFTKLLERTRETTLGAYDHQDVPFELLVEALRPERDSSRHPLFQILFTLQIAVTDELQLPDIDLSPFDLEKTASAFDLLLNCQEHQEGIRCAAEYNRDLFEPRTVETILGNFHHLLHEIVQDPEQAVGSISWSSEEEEAEDLGGFGMSLNDL